MLRCFGTMAVPPIPLTEGASHDLDWNRNTHVRIA